MLYVLTHEFTESSWIQSNVCHNIVSDQLTFYHKHTGRILLRDLYSDSRATSANMMSHFNCKSSFKIICVWEQAVRSKALLTAVQVVFISWGWYTRPTISKIFSASMSADRPTILQGTDESSLIICSVRSESHSVPFSMRGNTLSSLTAAGYRYPGAGSLHVRT